MARTRSIVAPPLAVVVAAVMSGCAGSPSEQSDALPPPPPVVELVAPVYSHPEDGLSRFVVRVPLDDSEDDTAAEQAGTTDDAAGTATVDQVDPGTGSAATGGSGDDLASRLTFDPALVASMPAGSKVIVRDGHAGYLDADGEFVSLTVLIPGLAPDTAGNATGTGDATDDGSGEVTPAEPEIPDSDYSIDERVAALRDLPGVWKVEPIGDGSYAVVATSPDALDGSGLEVTDDPPLSLFADPYEPYQWALDNDGTNLAGVQGAGEQVVDADIDGLEAAQGARGAGVVVAVIDTGVDFGHPDLAGRAWSNSDEDCGNKVDDDGNGYVDDCSGWDFYAEDNRPYSAGNNAHGTHVAGIIGAGADNGLGVTGIAPSVRIMDLCVSPNGSMTSSSIARAIRYAADNGADVVNLSLGTAPGTPIEAVTPIVDAVHYAESRGVLLVAAAGNDGVDITNAPVYPASTDATNMLTVGASTAGEQRASFSNYGQTVDVFAPGHLILSTVPGGYNFMSGTSQATPVTAAVAATIMERQPGADPATVIAQLVGTADQPAAYAGLVPGGYRINGARAIGIDPDTTTDPVGSAVVIGGLAGATTAVVHADITVTNPAGRIDQPFTWEASLLAITAGGTYGVVDHSLLLDGVEAITDERGAVELATVDAASVSLSTSLPPGDYALLVEAVPVDDPSTRIGEAYVARFALPDPDGPATTTTTAAPTTTTTAPPPPTTATTAAPTTTAPGVTTTAPATPPTTAPPTTVAPTTAPGSGGGNAGGGPTTTAAPPTTVAPTTTVAPAPTTVPATTVPATTTTWRWWNPTTTAPTTTTVPPTTVAPTTTTVAPAPAPAPTTAGPTTTAAPTTTVPNPGDTGAGQWRITGIAPTSGWIDSPNTVSIVGSFPEMPYVWFGDLVGTVLYHSSTWIVVSTPLQPTAAVVDLSLRTRSAGLVLSVPAAYAYYDPSGGATTTTTAAPGGVTSTTPTTAGPGTTPTTVGSGAGGGVTTSAPGGGGATSTTAGGGATTPTTAPTTAPPTTAAPTTAVPTTAAPPTTTAGSGLSRTARASLSGAPVDLANGLRGAPLGGLGSLGTLSACTSDPCRIRRI